MLPLEEIQKSILQAVPEASAEIINNPGPSGQHSLLVSSAHGCEVARFLRDHPPLRLDYCSNVTGVDWPEQIVLDKVILRQEIDGEEQEVEKQVERVIPGYLEVVYHLFSMALKHGPLILRLRTGNRTDAVEIPSLTSVWKSAEFQEREIFDLYGVHFRGHPDLRRLLMWDEFEGHPMRKDYIPPEDDEDRAPFTAVRSDHNP